MFYNPSKAVVYKKNKFRRFFPYYVYNLVAGLDDEGKGAVFSYDPVGSYDRCTMKCAGSAASLIQPFLDNQIQRQHIQVHKSKVKLVGLNGFFEDILVPRTISDGT